jgi:hypothetical protein
LQETVSCSHARGLAGHWAGTPPGRS